MTLLPLVAPVLQKGDWVDIGHDSAIKLDAENEMLLHRLEGKVTRHFLSWLVTDRALLNYALSKGRIKD